MIRVKFGDDLKGKRHYYLVGLDTYESFDQVTSKVLQLGSNLLDQVDSFYYRMALFELHGRQFKIFYHEDIGIYALTISDSDNDEWLKDVLDIIVDNLNT